MTQTSQVTFNCSVPSFADYPTQFEYYGVASTTLANLQAISTLLNLLSFRVEGDSYEEQKQAVQDYLDSNVTGHRLLVHPSTTNGKVWTTSGEEEAFVHPLDQDGEDVLVAADGNGSSQLAARCIIAPEDSPYAEFNVEVPMATREKLSTDGEAHMVVSFGLGRTEVTKLEVEGIPESAIDLMQGHSDARLAKLSARGKEAPHSVRVRCKYRGDAPSSAYALPVDDGQAALEDANAFLKQAEQAQRETKLRLIEARLRAIESSPRREDQRRCLRFDCLTSPTFIGLFVGDALDPDIGLGARELVGAEGLDRAIFGALREVYPALESSRLKRVRGFWTRSAPVAVDEELKESVQQVEVLLRRALDLGDGARLRERQLRTLRVWLSRFANRELAIQVRDDNDGSLNAEPEGAAFSLLAEFCSAAASLLGKRPRLHELWHDLYAVSLTALEVFFLRYGPRYGRRVPEAYERTRCEWQHNPPLTRDDLEAIWERYEQAEQESLPHHHSRLQKMHSELIWLAFRDARFARPMASTASKGDAEIAPQPKQEKPAVKRDAPPRSAEHSRPRSSAS